jgi:hypothetical protein
MIVCGIKRIQENGIISPEDAAGPQMIRNLSETSDCLFKRGVGHLDRGTVTGNGILKIIIKPPVIQFF